MIPRRQTRSFLVFLSNVLEDQERACRTELRVAIISNNLERASFARGGLNAVEQCRRQVLECQDLLDLIDRVSEQADIWFDPHPQEVQTLRHRLTGLWFMGIQAALLIIFRDVDFLMREG